MRNIPIAIPSFVGNEKKYLNECIETGWISSVGKFVGEFEEKFSHAVETKHALTCANGTVALHLALKAFDVGPGDEIIGPTLTYIASANAIKYCQVTPVFVDSDPVTWNMDPKEIESKITPRTKGIMVVHLYGQPCDMDPINEIAKRHGLFVLEDAAEALGASYKGKPVGSLGDCATFSFFGNKTLTTGEGGMISTGSAALAEKMRLYRGQGMDPNRRYWFPVIGYNYRMTNMQAAVGVAQLEKIDWHLQKRKEVALAYSELLGDLQDFVVPQGQDGNSVHSFWMFSVTLTDKVTQSRDKVMELMAADGIETRTVFNPMHVMPPYQDTPGKFPVAEKLAARGISLPTHAHLSREDVQFVTDRLKYHIGR